MPTRAEEEANGPGAQVSKYPPHQRLSACAEDAEVLAWGSPRWHSGAKGPLFRTPQIHTQ